MTTNPERDPFGPGNTSTAARQAGTNPNPGTKANANATANAANPNRNQNQPQNQSLSQQQHQHQNLKPNPAPGAAAGKPDAECQEAMQKMEAAGRPGPAHMALEPLLGDWKAEVKCWPEGTGEPHVSQGSAEAYWILHGRFLQEDFSGEMMGKPFKGMTLLGFDNTKQTYNSVWMCDTQTSIFTSEGLGTEGNRVITLEGKATCPMTGERYMKSVHRVLGPDKHTFEMYRDNRKTLEVTYTRA